MESFTHIIDSPMNFRSSQPESISSLEPYSNSISPSFEFFPAMSNLEAESIFNEIILPEELEADKENFGMFSPETPVKKRQTSDASTSSSTSSISSRDRRAPLKDITPKTGKRKTKNPLSIQTGKIHFESNSNQLKSLKSLR